MCSPRLQQIVGPGPVIQLQPLGAQPGEPLDKDVAEEEESAEDGKQQQSSAQPAKRSKSENGEVATLVAVALQGNETLLSKQVSLCPCPVLCQYLRVR